MIKWGTRVLTEGYIVLSDEGDPDNYTQYKIKEIIITDEDGKQYTCSFASI